MMTPTKFLIAAAVPMALLATPAAAATFTYTLTGAYQGSFTIDEAALPGTVVDGVVFQVRGQGTLDGRTGEQIIEFNSLRNNGGLTVGDTFANLYGPELFTGTLDAPVLSTGVFTLLLDGDQDQVVTLNVSAAAAAVPEPATWAMMIAGFGIVGASTRRSRRLHRVAA